MKKLMGHAEPFAVILLLGQDLLAKRLRPCFEQTRCRARHGTTKVLRALSLALYLLSDARSALGAHKRLTQIMEELAKGRGLARLTAFSP